MKKGLSIAPGLLVALIVSSSAVRAQSAGQLAGHWEGAIQVPGQEMKIAIDLKEAGGKWEGTIAIPAQNVKAYPLSIALQGEAVSLVMNGVPGNPQFKGAVSKDGKTLSGEFTQGGGQAPFALTRTGEATIAPPPKSTPISKELQGTWEGTVDVNGRISRFILTLSTRADGMAAATLASHREDVETAIPIAAVVQTGSHLTLDASAIGATYDGDLKDGVLTGTWTRGATASPLVFKRLK